MESNADKHGMNSAAKREPHEHQDHEDHHARMAADFRNRFWISLVLTLPPDHSGLTLADVVLALSRIAGGGYGLTIPK
jgi:hypothetical protein